MINHLHKRTFPSAFPNPSCPPPLHHPQAATHIHNNVDDFGFRCLATTAWAFATAKRLAKPHPVPRFTGNGGCHWNQPGWLCHDGFVGLNVGSYLAMGQY